MYIHAVERMMMFRQIMLFANFYGYTFPTVSMSRHTLLMLALVYIVWFSGCLSHTE